MATLSGTTPAATYPSLIKFNDNNPISATAKYLSDGSGTNLPISVSTLNVGIGTGTPENIANTSTLSISGSGIGGGAVSLLIATTRIGLLNGNDNYCTLQSYASRPLSLGYNGNNTIVVNTGNNVGIGETGPTAKLQVKGGGSTSGTFALIVQNSSGTELMNLDNGGTLNFANPTNIDAINISGFGRMNLRKIYGGGYTDNFLALDGFSITYNGGYSNGGHIFKVNSAEAVRISSNKNLLIGTTTDIASSKLTIDSTTQGILPPRMTTIQKNAIATPAAGLIVYDTTLNKLCVYTTAWETITSI